MNGVYSGDDEVLNFRQSVLLPRDFRMNIKVENEYIVFKTLCYAVEKILADSERGDLFLIVPDWLTSMNYGELFDILKTAGSRMYLIPESIFLALCPEIENGTPHLKISCGAVKYDFEISVEGDSRFIEIEKVERPMQEERISEGKIVEMFHGIHNHAFIYKMFVRKRRLFVAEVNGSGVNINENEGYKFDSVKKFKLIEIFDKYPVSRILFDFKSDLLEKNMPGGVEAKIFLESEYFKINLSAENGRKVFNKSIKLNNNISGVMIYDAVV